MRHLKLRIQLHGIMIIDYFELLALHQRHLYFVCAHTLIAFDCNVYMRSVVMFESISNIP